MVFTNKERLYKLEDMCLKLEPDISLNNDKNRDYKKFILFGVTDGTWTHNPRFHRAVL